MGTERRSGFDRRRTYAVTGRLRGRPGTLLLVLAAVNALSLLDYLLTAREISMGVAQEANPLLAGLFAAGPAYAWVFKTTLVLLVSIGIWRGRRIRAVLAVAVLSFAMFSAVVGYHFIGVGEVLWA